MVQLIHGLSLRWLANPLKVGGAYGVKTITPHSNERNSRCVCIGRTTTDAWFWDVYQ